MRDKGYFYLAIFSSILAFVVITLGAYTRLSDAGLGCPDWPGCYGHWVVKNGTPDLKKAWIEMIHRYFAGTLGILISMLAVFGRGKKLKVPFFLLILVIFQALLGMWTVTLKLLPIVVVAHLLGGMAIFVLLGYLVYENLGGHRGSPLRINEDLGEHRGLPLRIRIFSIVSLVLLSLQLFLGGWTSANYAALVCLDFPFCHGGQTPLSALMVIHMSHRMGALLSTASIVLLSIFIFSRSQNSKLRKLTLITLSLLTLQIGLGITNVLAILPLFIAVAHSATAALLLLSVVILTVMIYKTHEPTARLSYPV
jgi:heme a synthase